MEGISVSPVPTFVLNVQTLELRAQPRAEGTRILDMSMPLLWGMEKKFLGPWLYGGLRLEFFFCFSPESIGGGIEFRIPVAACVSPLSPAARAGLHAVCKHNIRHKRREGARFSPVFRP